jgi:hypothetical protein
MTRSTYSGTVTKLTTTTSTKLALLTTTGT